jgi:DNA (cytosine-5)-methyltransferase 1
MGYKMAGFDVRVAVEWMPYPAACYRHNLKGTHMIEGDVTKIEVSDLLSAARLQPGELDVFDGSPPCQGFSTAGKRMLTDPRNSLFKDYVRLLKGLMPKTFVMENVSGMVKGNMLLVFREILQELKDAGYDVACRLLNAADYGVPQARRRVFFMGVRNDLGIAPSHPKATVTKVVTVGDALPWFREFYFIPSRFGSNPAPSFFNTSKNIGIGRPTRTILKLPAKYLTAERSIVKAEVLNEVTTYYPAPALKGKILDMAERLVQGMNGSSKSWFGVAKLHPGTPSQTITKQTHIFGAVKVLAPKHLRGLSIGEVRRLSSFPDQYEFPQMESKNPQLKTWENAWGVMGNSVPPLLSGAIAQHIKSEILSKL